MISSRQLVAAAVAVLAALAVAAPVAGASAATTALPAAGGLAAGGSPGVGAVPFGAGNCGTATSLGVAAQGGGNQTLVCVGAGPVFVGPSVGQIATVMGPIIIGPAVVGATGVAAGSVLIR
jgi:hypothetical protein